MRYIEVDSSLLAWVEYFAEEQRLQLGFRSGDVYDYFYVPAGIYRALLEAESKGRYFNQSIRPLYRWQRLMG